MTRLVGHDSICCPGLPFVSDFPARPQAPENSYAHEADVEHRNASEESVHSARVYFKTNVAQRHREHFHPLWHGEGCGAFAVVNYNRAFAKVGRIAGNGVVGDGDSLCRTGRLACKVVGNTVVSPVPSVHTVERSYQPRAVAVPFFYVNSHYTYGRLCRYGCGFVAKLFHRIKTV